MTLDSSAKAGPSPMQALAFALAGVHGDGRGPCPDQGPSRSARLAARSVRSACANRSRTASLNRPALHDHRKRARGTYRPRDQALAREVLLGLAFDAAGHSADRHIHGQPWRVTQSPSPGNGVGRRKYLDWMRGLAVADHDRGARARQLDAVRRTAHQRLCVVDDRCRLWCAAVPLSGGYLGRALRRVRNRGARGRRGGLRRRRSSGVPGSFFSPLLFRVQSWILGLGAPHAAQGRHPEYHGHRRSWWRRSSGAHVAIAARDRRYWSSLRQSFHW